VGFNIVGETLNKWYDLRRTEFNSGNKQPGWVRHLRLNEQQKVRLATQADDFIRWFIRSQARVWQKSGINTIRVHQLFASWAGLDKDEIDLTVSVLKMLQQEEGFLILFDLLPNPDFTSAFFQDAFPKKAYAQDLSNTNLFKTTLVLPEVRDDYVKPAIRRIISVFRRHQFWPNSLSYCNETGFVHGFWMIDKTNAQAHPHFSRQYHYYYGRFLKSLKKYPEANVLIKEAYPRIQTHIQAVRLGPLLSDLQTMVMLLKDQQRIKDNANYIYYNLLWDGVLAKFPSYQKDLKALKDSFKNLVYQSATHDYYQNAKKEIALIETQLHTLQRTVDRKKEENAKALEKLLQNKNFFKAIRRLNTAVLSQSMPESYEIPKNLAFSYIDTFESLNHQQQQQAFFTSFLLPVMFSEEINTLLRKEAPPTAQFSIGLNNDFKKDAFALLTNTLLFASDTDMELRFNKYTHHPVGGHSMLLNPGHGNLFEEDSDIDLNLELFTPLMAAGYPARLSETNYTFAGDDRSGQGNWSVMDLLKIVADGNHVLGFRLGLNNVDKPVISDYFNIGNRPFKWNAFGMIGAAALARAANASFLKPSAFEGNRFRQRISVHDRQVSGLAGTFKPEEAVTNQDGRLGFTYTGSRDQVDLGILVLNLGKDLLIDMYGIERNHRQQNRAANPNLVQSYGTGPILYQIPQGVIAIRLPKPAETVTITGFTPTRKKVRLSSKAYHLDNEFLMIDTGKAGKGVVSYKVQL